MILFYKAWLKKMFQGTLLEVSKSTVYNASLVSLVVLVNVFRSSFSHLWKEEKTLDFSQSLYNSPQKEAGKPGKSGSNATDKKDAPCPDSRGLLLGSVLIDSLFCQPNAAQITAGSQLLQQWI